MWLLLGSVFLIVVLGIHEKIVKSDIAPAQGLPTTLVSQVGGKQPGGSWGSCWEPAQALNEVTLADSGQGRPVGEKNISWETWQVSIHFTIMKSII
jgi:hypothetical protein